MWAPYGNHHDHIFGNTSVKILGKEVMDQPSNCLGYIRSSRRIVIYHFIIIEPLNSVRNKSNNNDSDYSTWSSTLWQLEEPVDKL